MTQFSQSAQSSLLAPLNELLNQRDTRDSDDANRIYRYLVDLLLPDGRGVERAVRRELLDGVKVLIPRVDEAVRAEVVEMVLASGAPPADVVLILAQDKVSIVEPLLRLAPMDEDDVLELIKLTTRTHHQILADRKDLTANVWLALARAAPAMAGMRPSGRAVAAAGGLAQPHSEFDNVRILKPVEDANSTLLDDAEPEGERWSFRSDRDGFITSVSNRQAPWFAGQPDPHGQTILDLLGLNDKLGHPIARSVQRRTPIHDVPLFISSFPRGHRYWSIEAEPRFRAFGGTFDGYDATLTAVELEEAEDDVFTVQTVAADNPAPPQEAANDALVRSSIGQSAAQADDTGASHHSAPSLPADDIIADTETDAMPDTRPTDPSQNHKGPDIPEYTEASGDEVSSLDAALAAIARSMARVDEEMEARAQAEAEAEALAVQSDTDAKDTDPEERSMPHAGIDFEAVPPIVSEDVREAFSLLGDNLDKLQDAVVRDDKIATRLYADLAMAYFKAVRDQSVWD